LSLSPSFAKATRRLPSSLFPTADVIGARFVKTLGPPIRLKVR
jgi:hypothetical protein